MLYVRQSSVVRFRTRQRSIEARRAMAKREELIVTALVGSKRIPIGACRN